MASTVDVNKNKETFISLLRSVNREGMKTDELIQYLESSDFFRAPASTVYHNAFTGGLCAHCLNVYNELKMLVETHSLQQSISSDSVVIAALLHDISKVNFYEPTINNKKVYSAQGSKSDELGRFDWKSVQGFKVRDDNSRFIFGTHEETAEFLARCFVPLQLEESVAIIHHSGFAGRPTNYDLTSVYNNYTLALLLHLADMLATYYDERL